MLCSKGKILDNVKVTDNIAMIPLSKGYMAWEADKIDEMRAYERHFELQEILDAGCNITTEVEMLELTYFDYSRKVSNYDNSG